MSDWCHVCEDVELEDSECEGLAWHCADCRERCNECEGQP